MKKILSLVVVGILALSGLGAVGFAENVEENNIQIIRDEENAAVIYEDELDQEQPDQTDGYGIPVGAIPLPDFNVNFQVAQSFIPTKEILTRVELLVGKNSTASYPYVLAIREELTEENLVEISRNPGEFVTENYSWLEFDFEDIWVTVGQTYYVVCYTENVTDNFYAWAGNNDSESYPHGCAWVSIDDGNTWGNESYSTEPGSWNPNNGLAPLGEDDNMSDMCFKTYGVETTELEIEFVESGFPFPIRGPDIVIRNIGDAVAYDVEYEVTITGGFFGFINVTRSGALEQDLQPGENVTLQPGLFAFGLGPISIIARTWASNAPEVSDSIDGFLFIFLLLLK